jgi:hypothetical protein
MREPRLTRRAFLGAAGVAGATLLAECLRVVPTPTPEPSPRIADLRQAIASRAV